MECFACTTALFPGPDEKRLVFQTYCYQLVAYPLVVHPLAAHTLCLLMVEQLGQDLMSRLAVNNFKHFKVCSACGYVFLCHLALDLANIERMRCAPHKSGAQSSHLVHKAVLKCYFNCQWCKNVNLLVHTSNS